MLSHPPRVRSACHASPSSGNELRKNFFRSFSIETIFAFGKLRCGMGPGLQIHVGARKFCIREHGVRVFILGGTGVIGAPIVRELINRGHDVRALARSDISAAKLRQFGATRLRQARWAARLHKMRRCGSGAFDIRYTLNSGAKSNVAGCPSWVQAVCGKECKA